jgi:uncharacterized coiled-coil protein SlyX
MGKEFAETGIFFLHNKLAALIVAAVVMLVTLFFNIISHTVFGDAPSIRALQVSQQQQADAATLRSSVLEGRIVVLETQLRFQEQTNARLEDALKSLNEKIDKLTINLRQRFEESQKQSSFVQVWQPAKPGEGIIQWPGPNPPQLPNPPKECKGCNHAG